MAQPIILASSSSIRCSLLENAGLRFTSIAARIDEAAITAALLVEGATARDIADTLADFKAKKVADKNPDAVVIGCDQVLDLKGRLFAKPTSPENAMEQLSILSAQKHQLLSAAVVYENGRPVWRHMGVVQMHMRPLSEKFIADYTARNWESIQHAVGAYKLEEEGARLFTRVQGDYFSVLGLPLLDLLSYLTLRGMLTT